MCNDEDEVYCSYCFKVVLKYLVYEEVESALVGILLLAQARLVYEHYRILIKLIEIRKTRL